MYKNHDAMQSECDEYGSVQDTSAHINDVNYTFSILLFFRAMSDITKPIPMEVEEGGIEACMVD